MKSRRKGPPRLVSPGQLAVHTLGRFPAIDDRKAEEAPALTDDPTGWKAIDALRGIVKDAPSDVAANHDKYLYGDPYEGSSWTRAFSLPKSARMTRTTNA